MFSAIHFYTQCDNNNRYYTNRTNSVYT